MLPACAHTRTTHTHTVAPRDSLAGSKKSNVAWRSRRSRIGIKFIDQMNRVSHQESVEVCATSHWEAKS